MRSKAGVPLRITVVTSGHLSTCPRMLKAADALTGDGHSVHVVATRHEPWAVEADEDVRSRRPWPVTTIDYRRGHSGATYWRSGLRYRAARATATVAGPAVLPLFVAARALGRVHSELADAAAAKPADLVYGGTTGALAAVAEAARRLGVPYAIDLEDLHNAETADPNDRIHDALAARIETSVLKNAAFVTTSSDAIGEVYRRSYGVRTSTIHNTFPLPSATPDFRRADSSRLRVYWFSQTIGPGRGLEECIEALGVAEVPADVTLRGRAQPGYLEHLAGFAEARAAGISVTHHRPASPDAMIDLARGHDIGLAFEPSTPLNKRLCLSNKTFTYMLAGAAVVMSDTPGTHDLGVDLGEGAALVAPGDIDGVAAVFAKWYREPARLECARRSAWNAAVRRWRWDHELEAGRLCALVRAIPR